MRSQTYTSLWFVLAALCSCAGVQKNGTSSAVSAPSAASEPVASDEVESRIERTAAGELIAVQTLTVRGSVSEVWSAYTTSEGWRAWVAPHAEVDLRAGGVIRTNYNPNGHIGDPDTNSLRIVNYVPERLLTLQADVSKNWPEFMKKEAGHLYNVIVFTPLGPKSTRITSYGTGMKDDERYQQLIGFFSKANASLYKRLQTYVKGKGQGQDTLSTAPHK